MQLPDMIAPLSAFVHRTEFQTGLTGRRRSAWRRCPCRRSESAAFESAGHGARTPSLIGLEPHTHRRGVTVVRIPLQLVDQVFAPVVRLAVAAVPFVNEADGCGRRSTPASPSCWRDRRALRRRRLTLTLLADPCDASPSTRNAVFDRSTAIPTIRRAPSNQSALPSCASPRAARREREDERTPEIG
jgi:hypothetical protein